MLADERDLPDSMTQSPSSQRQPAGFGSPGDLAMVLPVLGEQCKGSSSHADDLRDAPEMGDTPDEASRCARFDDAEVRVVRDTSAPRDGVREARRPLGGSTT